MTKDNLTEICMNFILPLESQVVIQEPYIPYIPDNWNRLLVLAEAQNLSVKNNTYVEQLKKMSERERVFRLSNPLNLGIEPWDDGSLKLGIEAAFSVKAEETAVSNAVLWSLRDKDGNNVTPSDELINKSVELWSELLSVINPNKIITAGKKAKMVIDRIPQSSWSGHCIRLRLPSRSAMSRISGMFRENDLLLRYPEVRLVINRHPEWVGKSYRQNKIFFACHAVSLVKNQ